MKNQFFAMLSVFAALVVNADVMNWRIADATLDESYDYARLKYSSDVNNDPTSSGNVLATAVVDEGYSSPQKIDISSIGPTTKYFFIEVGQYNDGNFIAKTVAGAYSYSDLVSAGMISTGSMNPAPSAFGDASVSIPNHSGPMYGPVPEPSSAMLILVGLAVAGLKRRRV